jgi:hypothetical protein
MNNMTNKQKLYMNGYFMLNLLTMMLSIDTPRDVVEDEIDTLVEHYASYDDPLAQLIKEMKQ